MVPVTEEQAGCIVDGHLALLGEEGLLDATDGEGDTGLDPDELTRYREIIDTCTASSATTAPGETTQPATPADASTTTAVG